MAEKTITIGQTDFHIKSYSPMVALQVLGDLQKTVVPSIAQILESAFSDKAADDIGGGFSGGIRDLSNHLDGKTMVALFEMVVNGRYVTFENDAVDGKPTKIDDKLWSAVAFGDVGDMFELMFAVLELNYRDFFMRSLTRFGWGQSLIAALPTENSTKK